MGLWGYEMSDIIENVQIVFWKSIWNYLFVRLKHLRLGSVEGIPYT